MAVVTTSQHLIQMQLQAPNSLAVFIIRYPKAGRGISDRSLNHLTFISVSSFQITTLKPQ